MSPEEGRVALVFGATGLVGQALVDELLNAPGIQRIIAPVRRPGLTAETLGRGDSRLTAPRVAFDDLDASAGALAADQVFICLGTTMKKAGSRMAFRAVDHDAIVEAARVARDQGARSAYLVSSVGADAGSRNFYLQVKGETEDALEALGFSALHLFRPSILTGDRNEARPAERVGMVVGALLAPLMVGPARRYRPVAARRVARAMARAAEDPAPGVVVHEFDSITALAG